MDNGRNGYISASDSAILSALILQSRKPPFKLVARHTRGRMCIHICLIYTYTHTYIRTFIHTYVTRA